MSLPESLHAAVTNLRAAVGGLTFGQEDAKVGLMVGLIAREHVFFEGPPGCGKSRLAEGMAQLVDARRHVVAFHRDTREVDLLGDAVLKRHEMVGVDSPTGQERPVERLTISTNPGPLLKAEIVVLEDLSRAPGEALAPLLQILGVRRALGQPLPLETAVATAPPEALHTPVDPLEPGQLDRFAVQVLCRGLLQQRQWWAAARLLDDSADNQLREVGRLVPVLAPAERAGLQRYCMAMPTPRSVVKQYREWIRRVRLAAARASSGPVLLSDRSFGRTALQLMRAHAVLRKASVVQSTDLRVLRLMIGKRLPSEIHDDVELLTEELVQEAERAKVEVSGAGTQSLPSWLDPSELPSASDSSEAAVDLVEEAGAAEEDGEDEVHLLCTEQKPADVEALLEAFVGRIERGRSDPDNDPGGQPRSYRPLQRLDELVDGDLVEALLFTEGRLPGQPRTYRRSRRNAGGAVVILRDVSSSMAGQRNGWAGEVVAGLVRVASRRRMRVGYIEFHHRALPREVGGRLLHRAYPRLFDFASAAHPLGQTNYEEPLALALDSLKGRQGRNRHVVMLTDGLPITGDTRVLRERALAQRLGVCLHTVYIGDGECPQVLDDISGETNGLRFQARAEGPPGSELTVRAR